MFRKDWLRLVVLSLVVALSVGQILPTFAQDTAADVPAATESIMQVTATLGTEEGPLDPADLKTIVQEPEKAALAEADAGQIVASQYRIFLPVISTSAGAENVNEVSAALSYWHTIKFETFEGAFPNPGWVQPYDCGSVTNGVEYWGRAKYNAAPPVSWSAWVAGGNPKPPHKNPDTDEYFGSACAWMKYGPFKLTHAQAARMTFKYWNLSEKPYDSFRWMATCTGKPYFSGPPSVSGNSGGWKSVTLDLGNIPGLGSCVGTSADVWIAFRFISNVGVSNKGTFVDDVLIEELLQYPCACP